MWNARTEGVYAARDSRRMSQTAPTARIQGTSMKRPTRGQMFGSFGEDDPAHDGHAAAPRARSAAADLEDREDEEHPEDPEVVAPVVGVRRVRLGSGAVGRGVVRGGVFGHAALFTG